MSGQVSGSGGGGGYMPPLGGGGNSARGGVSVGGGSSTGRAIFALVGGLAGAYYGFYLQSKYMEERRVHVLVENEARKRFAQEQHDAQQQQ